MAAGAPAHRRIDVDDGILRCTAAGVREYRVALPGCVDMVIRLCQDGMVLRDVQVEAPGRITVSGRVQASPLAPGWLPDSSDYVLFAGDRRDAASQKDTVFVSFRPRRADVPETRLTMDRLVALMGQSVTRANARLAGAPAPGGVALAAQVNLRLAVRGVQVNQDNRVVLDLARPGEPAQQFVDVTLSTVPSDPPDSPGGTITPGGGA